MIQFITHYGMHFIVPGFIAYFFFREKWKIAYLLLLSTMLVDLDHVFAEPFFEPERCSIDYHPLHTYYAMLIYAILLIPNKTRIVAIGLLFHMLTDYVDCLW